MFKLFPSYQRTIYGVSPQKLHFFPCIAQNKSRLKVAVQYLGYTLFSTLSDMEVFQHRIENILKHIAGFELSEREKERHEDKSYEERVRSEYQSYFGCTPKVFDRPELKLIKPHVEVWERKEAEA